MDCQQELRYETHLVVLPERLSTGAEWTELRDQGPLMERRQDIPGHSAAVIVAVLDEPLFKKSSVMSISGAVFYKQAFSDTERSFQDLLCSAVEFTVDDLVQGRLKPFVSPDNCDDSDLVAVAVTSACWPLRVSPRHCLPAAATPLQLTDHGLREVLAPHCWLGDPRGSLEGLLVTHKQIGGSQHRLDLYSRDIKQAVQFVHSLSVQWKVDQWKDCTVSLQGCVKSLAAELRLLRTAALPNAHFTPQRWTEFRKQLSDLELNTDLSVLSYSPD